MYERVVVSYSSESRYGQPGKDHFFMGPEDRSTRCEKK